MTNKDLSNLAPGTVLKETYPDNVAYYIVGDYFIYTNDFDYPQIRPHKFVFDEHITVANDEESKLAFGMFAKNHLLWDENEQRIVREYDVHSITVKLKVKQETDLKELIKKLNVLDLSQLIPEIVDSKFIDF